MLLRIDGSEVGPASLDVETVECQTCEGAGEIEDFIEGPVRRSAFGYTDVWYGSVACPDCDGEGRVVEA